MVLCTDRYVERAKVAKNLNLPLVAALRSAGLSIRVCSQALVGNKVDPAMLIVMAYLAQEPTVYPDAWGYRDAMVALVEQWREP